VPYWVQEPRMFWFILLRVSTVIIVCKYAVQSGHNFRWNFLRSRFLYSLCAVKLEDWPLDNRYETRMRTKLMIERFRRSESNYVKTSTATLLLHSQGKPGQITDSRGLSTQTHFWDSSSVFCSFECTAHIFYILIRPETWLELRERSWPIFLRL